MKNTKIEINKQEFNNRLEVICNTLHIHEYDENTKLQYRNCVAICENYYDNDIMDNIPLLEKILSNTNLTRACKNDYILLDLLDIDELLEMNRSNDWYTLMRKFMRIVSKDIFKDVELPKNIQRYNGYEIRSLTDILEMYYYNFYNEKDIRFITYIIEDFESGKFNMKKDTGNIDKTLSTNRFSSLNAEYLGKIFKLFKERYPDSKYIVFYNMCAMQDIFNNNSIKNKEAAQADFILSSTEYSKPKLNRILRGIFTMGDIDKISKYVLERYDIKQIYPKMSDLIASFKDTFPFCDSIIETLSKLEDKFFDIYQDNKVETRKKIAEYRKTEAHNILKDIYPEAKKVIEEFILCDYPSSLFKAKNEIPDKQWRQYIESVTLYDSELVDKLDIKNNETKKKHFAITCAKFNKFKSYLFDGVPTGEKSTREINLIDYLELFGQYITYDEFASRILKYMDYDVKTYRKIRTFFSMNKGKLIPCTYESVLNSKFIFGGDELSKQENRLILNYIVNEKRFTLTTYVFKYYAREYIAGNIDLKKEKRR